MHYAKYSNQSVGIILQHSDRGIDSPDAHNHSNENIDRTRTDQNYDLKDRNGTTAYAYYKKRIDEIAKQTKVRTGKSIRKDAVTLCSWVVTVPKDLAEDNHKTFFSEAYNWFANRYGEDNIVTAAVHMDEITPHMHLQFTPIIERNGIRKLCAKETETRETLGKVHQKLQKHLENVLECPCKLINGATTNGNKKVLELKQKALKRKIEASKNELTILQARTNFLQSQIDEVHKFSRAKDYMSKLRFPDKTTALDRFESLERKRSKSRNTAYEYDD